MRPDPHLASFEYSVRPWLSTTLSLKKETPASGKAGQFSLLRVPAITSKRGLSLCVSINPAIPLTSIYMSCRKTRTQIKFNPGWECGVISEPSQFLHLHSTLTPSPSGKCPVTAQLPCHPHEIQKKPGIIISISISIIAIIACRLCMTNSGGGMPFLS